MKPNKEYDLCPMCEKEVGEIPISDNLEQTFWICELCDEKMDWVKEVRPKTWQVENE